MRTLSSFALVAALALVACGGSSSHPDASAYDLAVTQEASASTQGCYALFICASGCSGADVASCKAACQANGSTAGVAELQAVFDCAYDQCVPSDAASVDGGAGSCSSSTDTSAGCEACVNTQTQSQACAAQLAACSASS